MAQKTLFSYMIHDFEMEYSQTEKRAHSSQQFDSMSQDVNSNICDQESQSTAMLTKV